MADLKARNERLSKTRIVDMIDKAGETTGLPRGYLGMSQIGGECMRSLWYYFRWASEGTIDGRLNRLFQVGHKAEENMVKDLESIGIKTWDTLDSQAAFVDIGGYFSGHSDGMALGIPGAEKTVHLLEFKTSSDKYFKSMIKNGVKKDKWQHYCQMQLYMHYSKTTRALYMMYNKNDSAYYTERVQYDAAIAKELISKAYDIIFSENPTDFPRIGNNSPSWYMCKWCNYNDVCFNKIKPHKNCRTCNKCDLIGDGNFTCSIDNDKVLSLEEQAKGCENHQYLEGFNQ